MEIKTKVTFSFAKLASNLPRILEKTASRYARSSVKGARKNIDKGVMTAVPHSEGSGLRKSTLNIRHNRGITGTKPLYETGSLYRSIKAQGNKLTMNDMACFIIKALEQEQVLLFQIKKCMQDHL